MTKVLVLGGTGFLGSHPVRALVGKFQGREVPFGASEFAVASHETWVVQNPHMRPPVCGRGSSASSQTSQWVGFSAITTRSCE